MSLLSQRPQLHLSQKLAQKQILTPGLVQMVTVLQLNRLELKDMITQEVAENPVLEETAEGGEELTPEEVQALLEAERVADPADKTILEVSDGERETEAAEAAGEADMEAAAGLTGAPAVETETVESTEVKDSTDPFDEIDFGSFFDDYLDPGYKSPAAESSDKPSFETFLSAPVTLADYLHSQLSLVLLPDAARDAAESIVGNLDENGYLLASLEEIAAPGGHSIADAEAALKAVQALDPAGVGARDVRECLMLQMESRNGRGGVAWQILADHLKLVEARQYRELAKALGRPPEHIAIAVEVIKHLDPRPGLRYSGPGARQVEPDVYISKDSDEFIIQLNDEDIPQLRLHRAAQAHHSAGVPVDRAAPGGFSGPRDRPVEAHDDQGGGRGNRRPPVDGEPGGRQQVRAHPARSVRAALLLLGSGARAVGRRDPAADLEAQGQEDDRRRGCRAPADRRTHHRPLAGRGDPGHPPHGGQVP